MKWTGFNGAPGYSVMHFRDFTAGDGAGGADTQPLAQGAAQRVYDFFFAIRSLLPAPVRLDVEPDVDVLEDTTGELLNSFGITPPAVISGTVAGTYSAASGAVVNWRTGGIRAGRKIRGRTFIVPIAASQYDAAGQLATASRTTLTTAAAALAAQTGSPDLGVWARPTAAGASDGKWSVVTGSNVPSIAAILRSRRD